MHRLVTLIPRPGKVSPYRAVLAYGPRKHTLRAAMRQWLRATATASGYTPHTETIDRVTLWLGDTYAGEIRIERAQ